MATSTSYIEVYVQSEDGEFESLDDGSRSTMLIDRAYLDLAKRNTQGDLTMAVRRSGIYKDQLTLVELTSSANTANSSHVEVLDQVQARKCDSWSHSAVLALLAAIKDHMADLNSATARNKVWCTVAAELAALQITFTPDQCSNKWKNLKKKYREYKDNCKATGRGKKDFEFLETMDDMLGDRQSTSCTHTLSTLPSRSFLTDVTNVPASMSPVPGSSASATLDLSDDDPSVQSKGKKRSAADRSAFDRKTQKKLKGSAASGQFQDFVMDYLKEKQEERKRKDAEAKVHQEQKRLLQEQKLEMEKKKIELFAKLLDKM